jgi:mono/diheme cytochrome c family protein
MLRARVTLNTLLISALVGSLVVASLGFNRSATDPPTDPHARLTDPLADDLTRRLAAELAPFLAAHCLSCHTGTDAKADLPLDHLSTLAAAQTADLRLIREMIASGEMPPKSKPRPPEHDRLLATQWLDAALAYVSPDAPIDPGWSTPHRLNRTEYRLTLRDLLAINPDHHDLAERLPPDDIGYGFDNIADVLSTSPLAVEQYLAAAERAVDLALGPLVEFGDHPRPVSPLVGTSGQALSGGGFMQYSTGPVSGSIDIRVEADYLIRVRAFEQRGGDEHANLSLRVGTTTLAELRVDAPKDNPREFEVRARLKTGTHSLAAHFTNDFWDNGKADRNLGVVSISIAGPLHEKTTVRPKAHAEIFAHATGRGDDDRAANLLRAFASRAYRRPASDADTAALVAVYDARRDAGDAFEPAVRTSLTAALISPQFLFRVIHVPNPRDPDSKYPLDAYELASRLSYFLWSSMPDAPLLAAAADGSLKTDEALTAHVRRMLADPKSAAFIRHFAGQWLNLRALDTLAIDRAAFPAYDDALRADMREEIERTLADLLTSGRPVTDLLDWRYAFLNERLAAHYAVPNVKGPHFRRVTLPESSPRGGILTSAAVLTVTSNPTRTSPVKRGLFVLDQILGTPPPPPPADIPPLEQAENLPANPTVREQLAAHTTVASCAACHNRLDPLGLAFENFDAVGTWRTHEQAGEASRPIDASGTLPTGERLSGVRDLKNVLLDRREQFLENLAAKLMTYALGRGTEPFDRPAIRQIAARTHTHADRLDALIESIVLSDSFRTVRGREIPR